MKYFVINERVRIRANVDVFNVFNRQAQATVDPSYSYDVVNPILGGDARPHGPQHALCAVCVRSHRHAVVARRGHDRREFLFGEERRLAALGQAGGLVLSKQGMGGGFSPFAATLIRMIAAVASLWVVALFQGQAAKTVQTVAANPKGLRWAIFGSFFGPVFGVSASLLAVQHTAVGVASTIMALPPVVMLPISYFFYKEKLNWQSVLGTLVAIGGVALLFLR